MLPVCFMTAISGTTGTLVALSRESRYRLASSTTAITLLEYYMITSSSHLTGITVKRKRKQKRKRKRNKNESKNKNKKRNSHINHVIH